MFHQHARQAIPQADFHSNIASTSPEASFWLFLYSLFSLQDNALHIIGSGKLL
jgi:hypothetical protein